MNKYIASVYMTKHVTTDNYFDGCAFDDRFIYEKNFTVEFINTSDLIEELGIEVSQIFDIDIDSFIKYTVNEIENNRFDYCQNEDDEGCKIDITKENPNGYLADYTFYIDKVSQIIDYTFDKR